MIFFSRFFSSASPLLLLDHGIDDIRVSRGNVNVQTPLPAKRFPTMLAVDFLVYPLLSLMDGSDVLCHVTLSGEHFVAVWAGDALDAAVLGLAHVDVADVGAQVGLGAEYPDTQVTSLVDRAPGPPCSSPTLGHRAHLSSQGRRHALLLLLDVHRSEVHAGVGDVVVDDVLLLADEGGGGGEEPGVVAGGAGDAGGQGDQLRR